MERKIRDVFTLYELQFKVIEGFCVNCDLLNFCDIDSLRNIIGECWTCCGGNCIALDGSLFPEVKWSDKEPTKVKLVIEK